MITQNEKEGIITEYLTSEIRYRALGKKYEVDFRTLPQWVQNYQGKMRNWKKYTNPCFKICGIFLKCVILYSHILLGTVGILQSYIEFIIWNLSFRARD